MLKVKNLHSSVISQTQSLLPGWKLKISMKGGGNPSVTSHPQVKLPAWAFIARRFRLASSCCGCLWSFALGHLRWWCRTFSGKRCGSPKCWYRKVQSIFSPTQYMPATWASAFTVTEVKELDWISHQGWHWKSTNLLIETLKAAGLKFPGQIHGFRWS